MSKGLEPGATLPDFELPDENGVMHRLSELQGDNLLVLHLSRGEHCPRERMHHRELLRFHEWCAVAFTEMVSILPNAQHDVYKLKISTGARWTFLSDEQLEVQRYFDINEYTDVHHDHAGVPHTLILAPGLVIDKVYVGDWDPRHKAVMRYPLDPSGAPAGPGELVADLTGEPGEDAIDGIAVDRAGNLFVCGPAGIWVLSPAGERLGRIELPESPHNLTWGDADGRALYITALTSVYRMRPQGEPR